MIGKFYKVKFRGYDGYVCEGRPTTDIDLDKFIYMFRHSDNDWTQPMSIEDKVWVNYWGTIYFNEKPELDLDCEGGLHSMLTEEEMDIILDSIYKGSR